MTSETAGRGQRIQATSRLKAQGCWLEEWFYLNGVLAGRLPGYTVHYEDFDLRPEAVATLKPGVNTLAVHCHQNTAGQYVDVGLIVPDVKVERNPLPP
jgi:hypothetical protein